MQRDQSGGAHIPLGDFLTAEEPVWVWDAAARRILWANIAGRNFWGAPSLEDLRARRFNARSKAVNRMALLANAPGESREWTETLTLSGAEGRKAVKCYMQSLQVAGGSPGLIVKALTEVNGREIQVLPRDKGDSVSNEASTAGGTKNDRAAIIAIAARLKNGTAKRKSKKNIAKPKDVPLAAFPSAQNVPALPDGLTLELRELCHELRNPLAVILGFAERIKASPAPSRAKMDAYADNIVESAQLAVQILGDFSSRILHSGPEPLPETTVEIKPVVESCLTLIAPLAKQAGLKLSRKLQKDLPALPIGERVVKQMLLNVLMNAVRHQKTGGNIKITARMRKNGALRLTVADDGKGMTKKAIKTALGNVRGGKAAQPENGGSGLGLPLVKKLAENAGGTLSIESARGKGTCIELIFPPQS